MGPGVQAVHILHAALLHVGRVVSRRGRRLLLLLLLLFLLLLGLLGGGHLLVGADGAVDASGWRGLVSGGSGRSFCGGGSCGGRCGGGVARAIRPRAKLNFKLIRIHTYILKQI